MEQFDGWDVEVHEGKFSGGFDVDDHIATQIAYGDEVTFLVTASAKGVSFTDTADSQMKRTNSFKVSEALVLDDDGLIKQVKDAVINGAVQGVGGQIPGQLAIDTVVDPEPIMVDGPPVAPIPPSEDQILRDFLEGP